MARQNFGESKRPCAIGRCWPGRGKDGAGIYKLLFRQALIVETGDAIAALVRSTGSRGWLGIWLTERLEGAAFALADHVVVRGTYHQELLAHQGIKADVIQDGVDTAKF